MVDKYNILAKKKLKKALITERLTALSSLQREQWTDKHFKEYNALHQKSVAKIYFMTKDGTQTESITKESMKQACMMIIKNKR
jgi:hypothetical protein